MRAGGAMQKLVKSFNDLEDEGKCKAASEEHGTPPQWLEEEIVSFRPISFRIGEHEVNFEKSAPPGPQRNLVFGPCSILWASRKDARLWCVAENIG